MPHELAPQRSDRTTHERTPAALARAIEKSLQLPGDLSLDVPAGPFEGVAGYGIMGMSFESGHALGLRRWVASSLASGFTSIWHRDPSGRWTFYESVAPDLGCSRYFGADVDHVRVGPIELTWQGQRRLRIRTEADGSVDWTVELGGTTMTRLMSTVGSALPMAAWRSAPVLAAMGRIAGLGLGVGKVRFAGRTSNDQHFIANPRRIWYVTGSKAAVEGKDLGAAGPLPEQARIGDFYFPQRGIFAIGQVYVKMPDPSAARPG